MENNKCLYGYLVFEIVSIKIDLKNSGVKPKMLPKLEQLQFGYRINNRPTLNV